MDRIRCLLYKIALKIIGYSDHEKRNRILRNFFGYIGKNSYICTDKFGAEPRWIYIEDNVTVATGVRFVNHDASCWNAYRNANLKEIKQAEKVGSIILKKNCFIGAESILLPNIIVGENAIVAAGAVVTKSVPSNEVWGGVPACFIMSVDKYTEKMREYYQNNPWLNTNLCDLKKEQNKWFDDYYQSQMSSSKKNENIVS